MAARKSVTSSRRDKGIRPIAQNRRASFDYEIEDTYEAGIVLKGSEVKALREGHVEIVDAWVAITDGEAWLMQLYIAPYKQASVFGHESRGKRKLLLHSHEIDKLGDAMKDRGYTIVPTKLYFKDGRCKVEIALARGKNKGDKRHAIAEKTATREAKAAMGRARKGNE